MREERLIAFTDAVLAIIMTILILGLDKPAELSFQGLWEMRSSFFAYALSFFWLGTTWISLNNIWIKVERVSITVVWWNLIFLFCSSFLPYTTGLVSTNFDNRFAQVLYGTVVIATTSCNWILHKLIDSPNSENSTLLDATRIYRKLLIPDIIFQIIALILAITVYPPIMMYGTLIASGYVQLAKIILYRKDKDKTE